MIEKKTIVIYINIFEMLIILINKLKLITKI